MGKFSFVILLLSSIANAYTICDDLDIAVNEGYEIESVKQLIQEARKNDLYAECLEASGSSDIFFYSGEWVNTCEGKSDSKNGYIKSIVRCDFCDGANMQLQLQVDESICNAECKAKNTTCMRMATGWGGEIVKINPNGGDCGAFDPTLPGCSESSSSESELSSSSEIQSSSSVESSSSEIESSSSEDETESSSSEDFDSSSSEEDEDSSSSEGSCGEGGDHCGGSSSSLSGPTGYCEIGGEYREGLSRLEDVHVDVYNRLPYMLNRDDISLVNCYCTKSRFVACDFLNFGLAQGYTPIEMPMCGYKEGYWCNGIENGYCDFRGQTVRLYYTDEPNMYNAWWAYAFWEPGKNQAIETGSLTVSYKVTDSDGNIVGQTDLFSMRHLLPSNVIYQDLEDIVLKALPAFPDMNKLVAYCHNEWVPHDEDCLGTLDEVNEALKDSSDNCSISYGIPHYEIEYSSRGWCVIGECEAAEPYSSAEEYSSSSEESSSSEQSSSSEESSSSGESSSSEEISSSSENVLCQTLSSADRSNVSKSSCFENNGRCYRCHAGRTSSECTSAWSWVSPYHIDKYFFTEIDCESGERKDDNRIGQCPGFPMEDVPEHPEQACVAYNGKCYRCNPARGSECAFSWLWKETPFGEHNIGYFYEQVDCNDPFGKEDVIAEGCIDESFLKKEAVRANYQKVDDNNKEYYVDLMMTRNKYDALGRMRNHGSPQRMAYFNKKIPYKEEKDSRSDLLISGIIVASSDTLCNRLSSGEWVCGKKNILAKRLNDDSEFNDSKNCNIKLGRNYGIVENGNLVGGMTCAWPNVITSKAYKELSRESLNDGYIKIVVHYTITSNTILGDNDHLTVKEGYVFPNGHVTTSEEENQFDKHEEGHEFYNKCVAFEEINTVGQFECIIELKKEWSQKKKDEVIINTIAKELEIIENPLIEDKANEGQKKLDAIASRFHKDHGIGGYSDHYTCPTD